MNILLAGVLVFVVWLVFIIAFVISVRLWERSIMGLLRVTSATEIDVVKDKEEPQPK